MSGLNGSLSFITEEIIPKGYIMIEIYTNEIKTALQNKCYFTALALSLTLPDICGAVAFPEEPSTGRRYIKWCDAYLTIDENRERGCKTPYLSGEVLCNLRNTFLHTGAPNIDSNKVQDETNHLDKFMLLLGDGTVIQTFSTYIETPVVKYRMIAIDASWMCRVICESALQYYLNNAEKFRFDFQIETQEHLFGSDYVTPSGDPIIMALNQKLEKNGDSCRFLEDPKHNLADDITDGLHHILSNQQLKQEFLNGKKIAIARRNVIQSHSKDSAVTSTIKPTLKNKQKVPRISKREAKVRSFFGQHFKERKYKQKKEAIIQAVLTSRTRQQVNNALMQHFSSEEVGVIYKRLLPLIKPMPGK